MAVETVKSSSITYRDAGDSISINRNISGNYSKVGKGYAAVDAAASIGSKYILVSVPSNAFVHKVLLTNSAVTSGAGDVGVYKNTADGGAVVDADFFGSAVSIATALSGSNITFESGVYTLAKQEQPLWQALGLTSDPQTTYDIVITLTAAATAAGFVGLMVEYNS